MTSIVVILSLHFLGWWVSFFAIEYVFDSYSSISMPLILAHRRLFCVFSYPQIRLKGSKQASFQEPKPYLKSAPIPQKVASWTGRCVFFSQISQVYPHGLKNGRGKLAMMLNVSCMPQ